MRIDLLSEYKKKSKNKLEKAVVGLKKGSIFAPRNKGNAGGFGSSFTQRNGRRKNIQKIFGLEVVGIKKGFYICTRLSDKVLREVRKVH